MYQCPHCAEVIAEPQAEHCPYCGAALEPDSSPFSPSPSYMREPRFSLVLAVEGGAPAGETTLELTTDQQVIGRSEQADFRIALPSISRRHAAAWSAGGLAFIQDLGSQLGTFVNGMDVAEKTPLRPGDRVSLGNEVHFHLVVQEGEDEEDTHRREQPELELPPPRPVSTDLPRPAPDVAPPRTAEPERRHLEVLSELCSATVKLASEEELFDRVLEHLSRQLRADRFFAMVGRALETLAMVSQRGAPEPPPSKGIMRRVLYSLSDRPFVTCDAQTEKGISHRTSIMMSNVRSVMCVGLVSNGVCEGMLYVDTLGQDEPFSADDETFLHVVGQITAARLAFLRARAELDALDEELKLRAGGGGGLEPVDIS